MGWFDKAVKSVGNGFSHAGKSIGHGAERAGKWAVSDQTIKRAFLPGVFDPLTGMVVRGFGGGDFTAGEKDDPVLGGAKAEAARKAAIEEKAAQDKAAANEQMLLGRADAAYGIGLNPEAQANASRMAARRAAAEKNAFTAGQQQADQEYASGLSDVRGNLARSGTLGGGSEAQAKNDLMARYFGTINQAQQAGQQAGQGIDTTATTNRLALRAGVRGGKITDATGLGSEIAGLDSQGSNGNLWASSAGKFLPTAAGMYANNSMANAYGKT
jgi:hypothetical protein